MRAPRCPESRAEVAAAGRGTAPGEPGWVFLELLFQFVFLCFLLKCSMIFIICKQNVTQDVFVFPSRSVRRCERGKGNSL